MWLVYFVLPLIIVMVIGGMLAGGIFTIVFLPLALIVIGVAMVFTVYGKSRGRRTLPRDVPTAPGPTTGHSSVPTAPGTPG
ncbi:MAG: hypothetical protein WAU75_25460, partial [Solirubrobacteraceae bacterium]